MSFDWTSFLVGLLVGWLGEWVIDYFYWRRGGADSEELAVIHAKFDAAEARANELQASLAKSQSENEAWQARNLELETQIAGAVGLRDDLAQCRADCAELEAELALLRADYEALQQNPTPARTVGAYQAEADDLTLIQGIGPRFAEKLGLGGILTFAALAGASDDDLNQVIEREEWRKVDYDSWRAQAEVFAALPPERAAGDDLQRVEGIGPTYNELLRKAGIVSYTDLATSDPDQLAGIIAAPPWRKVDYPAWIAQAKLAAAGKNEELATLQAELNSRSGDNLLLIHGLGESYNSALAGAGITTYAQLAGSSPAKLEAVAVAAGLRRADFESWIEEAGLRAAGKRVARHKREYKGALYVSCPQDLEQIEGVGTVYERRLFEAGIGSFWEVAQLKPELLGEILEVKGFQDVDLEGIRRSAMALALETGSVNRVWDGSPPNDFEPMEGIGVVYERRLYAAGICTYDALANSTPDELERICRPPKTNRPDFAGWIAAAKELAAAGG